MADAKLGKTADDEVSKIGYTAKEGCSQDHGLSEAFYFEKY